MIAQALHEHLEPYAEAVAAGEEEAPADGMPAIERPGAVIWSLVPSLRRAQVMIKRSAGILLLLSSAFVVGPAGAQLRPADSAAVIKAVEQFHAALEAWDTIQVKGMLAPGAVVLSRGGSRLLRGEGLEPTIRWERAVKRVTVERTAQVRGYAAYVNTVSRIESRAAGGAIQGNEAETIVLSRLGNVWFIEVFHSSVGSDQ
jgi:hypothetical protein